MEVRTTDEGWMFDDMEPVITDMLRGLPACAATDDETARKRIFTAPTGGRDAGADSEWREFVEPELRELFKAHTDIVTADLAGIQENGDTSTLAIPAGHSRAWIHTLNQARLAIGARHGITEDDTSGRRRHRGKKGFAVVQIDVYGMLLSMLLSRTEL